ncbi:MAG: hypothetical protein WC813_01075 [Patescibacteria group bacterium]|jgi:hypothetical protein
MTSMQKAFIAAVATATIGAGSVGIGTAFAAETPAHPRADSLVQAIATKFNLSKDEVQKVFDEQRALGQAEHRAGFESHAADKLAKAVTDGKITQAQADLITAKFKELQTNKPNLQGKTPQEIEKIMKTHMDEIKTWMKDNDIPTNLLPGFGRPMMGGIHKVGARHMGMPNR